MDVMPMESNEESQTQMPSVDESQTQMPLDMMLQLQMPLEITEQTTSNKNVPENELSPNEFDPIAGEDPVLLDTVMPQTPPRPDFEFAHVLNTNDLIDYSSSSHIHKRGAPQRVVPVARYFPLVPPPSYQPPGNAIKSIHQQVALRLAFLRNNRPTKTELLELSAQTGLPWLEIATWFKGERWRVRRTGGIINVQGGKPTPNAWQLIMEGITMEAPPTKEASIQKTIEERKKEKLVLRKKLTSNQIARANAWAAEFADIPDAKEREFRTMSLVDQLDFRGRKDLRKALIAEPSLAIKTDTEYKTRKSCADATCTREVVINRADDVWSYMESRFGSCNHQNDEKYVDDDGNILLDASLLSGMECMFLRHRDYFMALVHRLKVNDFFEELREQPPAKKPRTNSSQYADTSAIHEI
ncbi:hypothetical protein THRCLA_00814 [Thraustotheca clavata]|uniref:Homeobox domain-containing protein n=1 Tax=Thraustotheca clavata TaxID=74557 RepID=A0A1W0AB00_9STRA|nr:hypothetical protein THRCLA_00814 [Thraustotheca clavata]